MKGYDKGYRVASAMKNRSRRRTHHLATPRQPLSSPYNGNRHHDGQIRALVPESHTLCPLVSCARPAVALSRRPSSDPQTGQQPSANSLPQGRREPLRDGRRTPDFVTLPILPDPKLIRRTRTTVHTCDQPEMILASAFPRAMRTLLEGASGVGKGRKVWRGQEGAAGRGVAVEEGSSGVIGWRDAWSRVAWS